MLPPGLEFRQQLDPGAVTLGEDHVQHHGIGALGLGAHRAKVLQGGEHLHLVAVLAQGPGQVFGLFEVVLDQIHQRRPIETRRGLGWRQAGRPGMEPAVRQLFDARQLRANGLPGDLVRGRPGIHEGLEPDFQLPCRGRYRLHAEGAGATGQAVEQVVQGLRLGRLPVGQTEFLVLGAKGLQLAGKRGGKLALQILQGVTDGWHACHLRCSGKDTEAQTRHFAQPPSLGMGNGLSLAYGVIRFS